MIVRLADLRMDSWVSITREIREGRHPEQKYLLAALRRQEPDIPAEAQAYIADLIEGKVDRRGRPLTDPEHDKYNAFTFLLYINKLERDFRAEGKSNPQALAFEQVAKKRVVTVGAVKKKYLNAKKKLDHDELFSLEAMRVK